MEELIRLHVVLITHAIGRSPCCDSLQLILKHVAPAIALNDEQYLPPAHIIQILVAVAPDLAYDYFERFVGVRAFFGFAPFLSSISFSMVLGTNTHSWRICMTAATSATTSSRVAV